MVGDWGPGPGAGRAGTTGPGRRVDLTAGWMVGLHATERAGGAVVTHDVTQILVAGSAGLIVSIGLTPVLIRCSPSRVRPGDTRRGSGEPPDQARHALDGRRGHRHRHRRRLLQRAHRRLYPRRFRSDRIRACWCWASRSCWRWSGSSMTSSRCANSANPEQDGQIGGSGSCRDFVRRACAAVPATHTGYPWPANICPTPVTSARSRWPGSAASSSSSSVWLSSRRGPTPSTSPMGSTAWQPGRWRWSWALYVPHHLLAVPQRVSGRRSRDPRRRRAAPGCATR